MNKQNKTERVKMAVAVSVDHGFNTAIGDLDSWLERIEADEKYLVSLRYGDKVYYFDKPAKIVKRKENK